MTSFIETSATRQTVGKLRVVMVYTRNDFIQQILPFILQINANAILGEEGRFEFPSTTQSTVLTKVENKSAAVKHYKDLVLTKQTMAFERFTFMRTESDDVGDVPYRCNKVRSPFGSDSEVE